MRMHRRARGATFKEPKLYFIYLMPDPLAWFFQKLSERENQVSEVRQTLGHLSTRLPKCSLLKDVSLPPPPPQTGEVHKQNAENASWNDFSSLTTVMINYLLLHMVKRNAKAAE